MGSPGRRSWFGAPALVALTAAGSALGAETPMTAAQDIRRRAEVLVRELRRRPNHLVTYTYYSAHGDDERRDITGRELAEEQLKDLESNGPDCDPDLERRLRSAM